MNHKTYHALTRRADLRPVDLGADLLQVLLEEGLETLAVALDVLPQCEQRGTGHCPCCLHTPGGWPRQQSKLQSWPDPPPWSGYVRP